MSGWPIDFGATGKLKWLPYLLLVGVGVLTTSIYSFAPLSPTWAHLGLSLVYIPVVAAAIRYGALIATLAGLAGGILHVLLRSFADGCSWIRITAEMLVAVCVAWLAAAFAGRQRLRVPPQGALGALTPGRGILGVTETWSASALTRAIVGLVGQFGTPIASIEGAGWMLDDTNLPEEKRLEFVGIIRKESHRLSRTLSELLMVVRPREPQFERLDLSALMDTVIQFASPKDRGHSIVFEKRATPDLPPLHGDAEQIRQALLNLVTNAVQATPRGGRVEFSVQVENGYFVIAVEDHGHGIPETALGRIFDPFFTTREDGLGLGLPVAQHIINEHGGSITIDSIVGKGTRALVVLPVRNIRQK